MDGAKKVERVESKRVVGHLTEYFIKWKGLPSSKNTWESEKELNCPDLLARFEESQKKNVVAKKRKQSSSKTPEKKGTSGFDRGLEPLKILGASDLDGKLIFLVNWKGSNNADFVTAEQANQLCPQLVIKFYEERIAWTSVEDGGCSTNDPSDNKPNKEVKSEKISE
ncbi:chromobox protein homolog 1 [Drosophila ficusphila]|uniref:chromobox protein homolog 1 n=1 Tax=Drosophila ficusphila TaxID=30025 RepID=UPI001C8AAA76|nr:chromobox protein homolog 1 [Drosophila ficusphila]